MRTPLTLSVSLCMTKAMIPQQLMNLHLLCPFYHSCHKLALIASISCANTPDLRVWIECCLQTQRFWWWWLYGGDNTVLHNDTQHGMHITHTHTRTAVMASPLSPSCQLPLVTFYLDKNKTVTGYSPHWSCLLLTNQ